MDDEIVRVLMQIRRLDSEGAAHETAVSYADMIARLTEENTRYREALDEIEKVCTSSLGEIETIATCLHVARAALVKGEAK